jgi:hypothetical protein
MNPIAVNKSAEIITEVMEVDLDILEPSKPEIVMERMLTEKRWVRVEEIGYDLYLVSCHNGDGVEFNLLTSNHFAAIRMATIVELKLLGLYSERTANPPEDQKRPSPRAEQVRALMNTPYKEPTPSDKDLSPTTSPSDKGLIAKHYWDAERSRILSVHRYPYCGNIGAWVLNQVVDHDVRRYMPEKEFETFQKAQQFLDLLAATECWDDYDPSKQGKSEAAKV